MYLALANVHECAGGEVPVSTGSKPDLELCRQEACGSGAVQEGWL
jgi:hypothetical protein